ncbi:uncharacterized protein LOC143277302 isoform X2 [Babylonia areolata]|uniref:uncharacterized protein LOC143277302 isoform X2 n=1 Tax=Babylonia areolata TaxID=304850 RepID=UPI003FD60A54
MILNGQLTYPSSNFPPKLKPVELGSQSPDMIQLMMDNLEEKQCELKLPSKGANWSRPAYQTHQTLLWNFN